MKGEGRQSQKVYANTGNATNKNDAIIVFLVFFLLSSCSDMH